MIGVSARGWAYVGAVTGGAVSVAANVAHSYVPPVSAAGGWSPQPGAVVGAVFWPVALLVAVEILARTAWPSGARWVLVRWLGLLPVALVAAVVSYRHLSGLLTFYGEDALTAMVGPVAVDGLMIMATGALLATARHDTASTAAETATSVGTGAVAPVAVSDPVAPVAVPRPAASRRSRPRGRGRGVDTAQAVARARVEHPDLSTAGVAALLGVSARTVRRHAATDPASGAATVPDTSTASRADTGEVVAGESETSLAA